MTSPYIETLGITEQEHDEIQKHMNEEIDLPPSIQSAIEQGSGDIMLNGDHYNATLEALSAAGWKKQERLSFKEPSIKGVRYKSADHRIVDVIKADFLGVFTSITFKEEPRA
jgi:hypothetical protein